MDSVASNDAPLRTGGKSPEAFRTIAEVAQDLEIPQHVLRFWETKFPQVKPLKRGGGRRYYRPDDVALLRVIRDLLYEQGYTIRGAQQVLQQHRPSAAAPQAKPVTPAADASARVADDDVRKELRAIMDDLEDIRRLLAGGAD